MEKICLQCGAELKLIAVPLNPNNAGSPSVAACSACGSQKYDTPNGVGVDRMKSQEALDKAGLSCETCEGYVFRGIELLTAQRDELLAALKDIRDMSLNPAHTMTYSGLEGTVDGCHKTALMYLEKYHA